MYKLFVRILFCALLVANAVSPLLFAKEKEQEKAIILIRKPKKKGFLGSKVAEDVLLSSNFYQAYRKKLKKNPAYRLASSTEIADLDEKAFLRYRDHSLLRQSQITLLKIFSPLGITLSTLGVVSLLVKRESRKGWMYIATTSLLFYLNPSLAEAFTEFSIRNTPQQLNTDPKKTRIMMKLAYGYVIFVYSGLLAFWVEPLYLIAGILTLYLLVSLQKMYYPLLYLLYRTKIVTFPMEKSEIFYIRNQHRLDPSMQVLIEKRLKEAMEFPEKQVYLNEFIQNAIKLPSAKEVRAASSPPKNANFSTVRFYEKEIKKWFAIILIAYSKGNEIPIFYIHGRTGVGKTNIIREFAKIAGAAVAEVSFSGDLEMLLGKGPNEKEPGRPGRIYEAIMQASPYGKKPVILYIDELDKALLEKGGNEKATFLLEIFEGKKRYFESPYFPGHKLPRPAVIICSGNLPIEEITNLKSESLKKALIDRIEQIYIEPTDWSKRREMIREKLPKYFKKYNIKKLTEEEEREMNAIIDAIEKETKTPKGEEKYADFRQIEKEIKEYLEDRQMRAFYKEVERKKKEKRKKKISSIHKPQKTKKLAAS